jgi:ADP-heptose:LPS heptosyltransferase
MEVESEYVRLEKIVNKYLKLPLKNSYSYDFIKFDSSFQQYCLKTFGFLDKPFITLGIGGKTKIQRWDIGNYIEVLDKVSNDINFVILGGKDDINNADLICKKSENKNIINLCAETSILESAYILSRTKLYFGNDTGTLHLASIVGAKCLVVSSARDNINRWNPYGNNHMVIRKHPSCEGCWLHQDYCSFDIKCMTDISVDEVFDKLIKVIND